MARFEMTDIICECEKVTLGEIIYAIKEKDCKNLESIINLTGAGKYCGCCSKKEKDFNIPKKKIYLDNIVTKLQTQRIRND